MSQHVPTPDPDAAALYELRNTQSGGAGMRERGLAAVRAVLEALPHPVDMPKMAAVEDRDIPCVHGQLPIRVYSPTADAELPGLVYFHAGGLVMGTNHSFEPLARALAEATGHRVFAVEYHLAPEHPPPGQIEDAWAATEWVAAHAAELGVLPDRISVLGDSAGGTLAALVALRARDRGGPRLLCQVLVYGGLDRDMAAASMHEMDDVAGLSRDDLLYLHELARAGSPEPASGEEIPAYCPDLRGVAPAIVAVGELDPVRDWSQRYAARLGEAGVQTTFTRYPGVGHGFLMQQQHLARGRLALREIAGLLRAKAEYPLPW
ncbi:alpha/beta hydrolase [Streptomyces sp. VNUA24]|uniref:alpha/beta hydrolase n=1 Tax=Streptomyces sp. VNUA24 TaxID=3031131 RepID=UPI0023B77386|nr:alpha/beta hydrolase [Streptomyces sp. VNUA24]WEH12899.1 alpha/beta hydrolase [Streptomyces sp. VNUA24]